MLPIQVMIVDDHPMVRQSLTFALRTIESLEVINESSNGLDAILSCLDTLPDMIMMDADMPLLDGIEATRIIHGLFPGVKIIVLTCFDTDQQRKEEALAAGAILCLDKQTSLQEFVEHLRSANLRV